MSEEALEQQSFDLAIAQDKTIVFTLYPSIVGTAAAWTMAIYIRSRAGVALVTKTTGSGITYTGDAVVQKWDVAVADTDTDSLKPGLASWSFWRTDDGSESPLAVGTCEVYRTSRTG